MSYNNGKSHPRFIELTGKQFGKLKILFTFISSFSQVVLVNDSF